MQTISVNGRHLSFLTSLILEMANIRSRFLKMGLKQTEPTRNSRDKIRYGILKTHPEFSRQIERGDAEINIKQLERFENRHGDRVDVADYDIVTRQRTTRDPLLVFDEGLAGRLYYPCQEVIHFALRVESGVQGISKGTDSRQFKQCVAELAQIENISEAEAERKIVGKLYNTWMASLEQGYVAPRIH